MSHNFALNEEQTMVQETVRKLVSDFYDKVLENEDVARIFRDTEMSKLIDHQTKFWATLLGGPVSYTSEQLRKLHVSMGIEDRHFDIIRDLVQETLEDHDIDDEELDWGYVFLVKEKRPRFSFQVAKYLDLFGKKSGVELQVISREHPKKIKKRYDLEEQNIYWLSKAPQSFCLSPTHQLQRYHQGYLCIELRFG